MGNHQNLSSALTKRSLRRRRELEELIDLRVLVVLDETDCGQRLDRRAGGADRHAPSAWDARWDAAERVHFDMVRPEHEFDLVIDG